MSTMRLRLYHHPDGARIAYREAGAGRPLILWHAAGLSHRELTPVGEELADRFRVILPDLPLHGDSEDRLAHSYSPEWLAEVVAGFCHGVGGPHPWVGGHHVGAQLVLRAVAAGQLTPGRLILLPSALHRRPARRREERIVRGVGRIAGVPGARRLAARAAEPTVCMVAAPRSAQPAVRALLHHAFAGLDGSPRRAQAWARALRQWPRGGQPELLDAYRRLADVPTLLVWADDDPRHPISIAEEVLELLPHAQLRELGRTGFFIGLDDPVGVAREVAAFSP